MDRLSYHRAVIDCYEKIVCIPLPDDEILEVQGERPEKDPGSLACIKADEKTSLTIEILIYFSRIFHTTNNYEFALYELKKLIYISYQQSLAASYSAVSVL
ncbi:hypothetical protein Tco_0468418 [Tanacetum coccineum]